MICITLARTAGGRAGTRGQASRTPESHWNEHRADAFAAVDISARAAFMADDAGDVRKGQGSTHLDKGTFAERFFDPAFDAAMGLLDVTQKRVDARRRMSGCAG